MSTITLKRVESAADRKAFVDLVWKLYANDPHWVPPLRMAVRDLLNVEKNPFFRHAIMHPVMAIDTTTGKCLGRIVGVVDENHNQFHDE